VDGDTLLVSTTDGTHLREVKDFALMQEEVYEFEWNNNKFRRSGDVPYEELVGSIGNHKKDEKHDETIGKGKHSKRKTNNHAKFEL